MTRIITTVISFLVLTACTAPATLLDMSSVSSELRLRSSVSSVMMRDVSLPAYAAAEEIAREISPGLIETDTGILWADDPERAVTLAMTRHLDEILNASVGPDPWPFIGLPDVAVEVRVAEMLASANGSFKFSGQYYVGGDGIEYPNSSIAFSYAIPLADGEVASIALAQSQAILALSEDIARKFAR